MTTHACSTDREPDQYKILRHLFHLACDNSPKDWELSELLTEVYDHVTPKNVLTEYTHRQTGDVIKAQSWGYVDGELTNHLFTFKQGSGE